MKASSLRYLIRDGAKNIWLNRMLSIASIGILTTCLLLIGFSWLITTNINSIVKFVENKNEIVLFIREGTTEEQITSLQERLEADDRLMEIQFISKEQGLEDYKESLGDGGTLLEGLEDDNPIPASFRFKAVNLADMSDIADDYSALAVTEKMNAPTDVADTLSGISNMINVAGIVLIAALVVVSLIIISNTIRATVFARRKEINIMKYVGATNNFIRIPFFVEGLLLGLISAALAFLLVWLGYSAMIEAVVQEASSWIGSAVENLLPFDQVALPLAGIFAAAGSCTGVIGCMFSIRNHLKV